jgi:hypothetical protein
MTDTPAPELTLEAMKGGSWDAALTLPLPKEPSLKLLDEARSQVLDYLAFASDVLPECADPYGVSLDITSAAERLVEIALERAAAILAGRLQRRVCDENLP